MLGSLRKKPTAVKYLLSDKTTVEGQGFQNKNILLFVLGRDHQNKISTTCVEILFVSIKSCVVTKKNIA